MNIKTGTMTTLLGGLALAGSAIAFDDVNVYGTPPHRDADSRAVQSCVDAFVAEALPGRQMKVRVVTKGAAPIFGGQSYFGTQMDVSLSARARSTGALLASATCTVSNVAKVTRLITQVTDPARLAAIPASDLKLALASR
jgi:hypothetical protein